MTMASGADSSSPRNLASAFLPGGIADGADDVMFRAVANGLRLISTAKVLPFLRSPNNSRPAPMGRTRGS